MDSAIDEVVRSYARQVRERYQIDAIYLYGSQAKGTATKYSDIDIAVIIQPTDSERYMNIFSGLYELASNYKENIEPNLLVNEGADDKYSFLSEVMRTGRLIAVYNSQVLHLQN